MNAMLRTAGEQKLLTNHPALLIGDQKRSDKRHVRVDMLSIKEIQHRAETITPVLKAILDFRPRPCWR